MYQQLLCVRVHSHSARSTTASQQTSHNSFAKQVHYAVLKPRGHPPFPQVMCLSVCLLPSLTSTADAANAAGADAAYPPHPPHPPQAMFRKEDCGDLLTLRDADTPETTGNERKAGITTSGSDYQADERHPKGTMQVRSAWRGGQGGVHGQYISLDRSCVKRQG